MSLSSSLTSQSTATLSTAGPRGVPDSLRSTSHGLLIAFGLSFAAWNRPYMPIVLLGALAVAYKWLRALADRRLRLLALTCLASLIAIHYWSSKAGAPWDMEQRDLVSVLAFLLAILQVYWILKQSSELTSSLFIAAFGLGWTIAILAFYVPQPGYSIWKYGLAQPV